MQDPAKPNRSSPHDDVVTSGTGERHTLPSGEVTFCFTDIAGSTTVLRAVGPEIYETVISQHRKIILDAATDHGGSVVDTEGDGTFLVFATASGALAFCVESQIALGLASWPAGLAVQVRMGVHTGEAISTAQGSYIGLSIHQGARIAAAAHGGQIILSDDAARRATLPSRTELVDLGGYEVRDFDRAQHLFQVKHPALPRTFPPPRLADAGIHTLLAQRGGFPAGSMSFGLLGPLAIVGEHGEIDVRGARRVALARLLIAANRLVAPERLLEDLSFAGHQTTAAALNRHIAELRKLLGSDRLVRRDKSYQLRVGPEELDVTMFERDAAKGRELLRLGDARGAADALRRGLSRWRGAALEEVATTSWGQPEAVRLEEMRATALEGWLEARLLLGEFAEVVAEAEAAVRVHPLRESLWAKLITALYQADRTAESIQAYERLSHLLADSLGIKPSPAVTQLIEAVRRQDLSTATTPRRSASSRGTTEPRVSLAGTGNHLPADLTSFVPRPTQEAELAALLGSSGLVTLIGAGGTGKTRLSLRAASIASSDFDDVWMCELALVDDGNNVAAELASTIGANQSGADPITAITQRLSEGHNLVILDNCEHLLDDSARLAMQLRRAVPQLTLLATSRSPLGVPGEVTYRVPSMSVPPSSGDTDEVLQYESVRLFVERAQAQQTTFALTTANKQAVVAVCSRLDGIPLALELAAARLRSMSVGDVAQRLDNRLQLLTGGARTLPRRQQTLRALIDWSYDMLDPDEQDAFGRLSVFVGSFDLSAANAILSNNDLSAEDLVTSLVDKSLLQFDSTGLQARYRMLETVREYAVSRLLPTTRTEAKTTHAAYFARLASTAAPHFAGSGQLAWRKRLEPDDDNLRAAFLTLLAQDDTEVALQFGSDVNKFWNCRGDYGDEMDLLEKALDRPGASVATEARAAAAAAAGYVMFRRGRTLAAQARLEEALKIARDFSSAALAADALRTLAWVADRRGERATAQALAEEALAEALASGDGHLIARAYDVRAGARQVTEPTSARDDYASALTYCEALGDGMGQATSLNNLAILELEQHDHLRALAHFRRALAIAEDIEDVAAIPVLEYGVALAGLLDDDLASAEPAFVKTLNSARRTGQRGLVAYSLLGIGVVFSRSGREAPAATLLAASAALFRELGEEPERTEAALRDQAMVTLELVVGDGLPGALDAGGKIALAQVISLAGGSN